MPNTDPPNDDECWLCVDCNVNRIQLLQLYIKMTTGTLTPANHSMFVRHFYSVSSDLLFTDTKLNRSMTQLQKYLKTCQKVFLNSINQFN